MATIFESGLETETDAYTTEWTGKSVSAGNSLTVSATAAHVNSGSKGGFADCIQGAVNALAYKTFADQTELYLRAYFKIPVGTELNGNYDTIAVLYLRDDTAAQNLFRVGIQGNNSTTVFRWSSYIWNGTGFNTWYSSGTVTPGQWHYIEFHWKAGTGADGGGELKIDGSSVASVFTYDLTAYSSDRLSVGNNNSNAFAAAGGEIYFDDILISDSDWPGPVATGVEIAPATLTTEMQMFNPTVANPNQAEVWDMGPYIYTAGGTGVAINPGLLQTSMRVFNPTVSAVDVPVAIAPGLLSTEMQMFNPIVQASRPSGKFPGWGKRPSWRRRRGWS